MPIRDATVADVPRISALLQQRREIYQSYSPIFWNIADGAAEKQMPFLQSLVENADIFTIVHENGEHVNGVLFASTMNAPPVYDPGGKVCMIDDYMVEAPELWPDVGHRLLEHCRDWAQGQGCVLQIIVCGQKDVPKATMLKGVGAEVASEWYVKAI